MENNEKTANQLYRESGSSLSFADWIEQEKEKNYFIKNDTLSNLIKEELETSPKETTQNTNKKILGLSKNVIILSTSVIAIAVIYKVLTKTKK